LRLDAGLKGAGAGPAVVDVRDQLEGLFGSGFVVATPPEWLDQYPRYLAAAGQRLDRIESGRAEDRERAALREHARRVRSHRDAAWPSSKARAAFEAYRWLTEEFRVSLFAQTLGTRVKVSAVRLERLWAEVEAARHAAA
jgi:ATP-dependent helicase HrpA